MLGHMRSYRESAREHMEHQMVRTRVTARTNSHRENRGYSRVPCKNYPFLQTRTCIYVHHSTDRGVVGVWKNWGLRSWVLSDEREKKIEAQTTKARYFPCRKLFRCSPKLEIHTPSHIHISFEHFYTEMLRPQHEFKIDKIFIWLLPILISIN